MNTPELVGFMKNELEVTITDEHDPEKTGITVGYHSDNRRVPLRRRTWLERRFVELIGRAVISKFRIEVHHDPAGERGKTWLASLARSA